MPKASAPDVLQAPLRAALPLVGSERDARQAEPQPEAVPVCVAAQGEELAQVRAAAEPQPEAATAASERPVAGAAAEVPDARRAGEVEEVAVPGVRALRPEAAQPADAEVRRQAAARLDVRELQAVLRPEEEAALLDAQQAAVPSVLPSEAASICRSLVVVSAPARPRAVARSAHAMRSLRIASRSEPSLQAARNEGWS